MADLQVRNLDDRVAAALQVRAARRGVSLEEEARRTLAASVATGRRTFARGAATLRATVGAPSSDPKVDSVAIIRQERDDWG